MKVLKLSVVAALLSGVVYSVAPAAAVAAAPDDAIVFWSARDGNLELYLTRPDGASFGNLSRQPGDDVDPAWSPSGSTIAFARRLGHKATYEIFTMSAEGGGLRRLTTNGADDRQPAWSPDGTRIAFARSNPVTANSEIFVMNADGSGQQRLTFARAGVLDAGPAWSPDGTRIAFTSNRDGGLPELFVMNASGSGETRVTANQLIEGNPSWSPSGTAIAFDRCCADGSWEIYTIAYPVTGVETNLTKSLAQNDVDPEWSPDGTSIAFAGHPASGGNRDIYAMNADGTGQVRLTDDAHSDLAPDWHHFDRSAGACTMLGTTGNDVLPGTNGGPDVICGLGGDDELRGLGGNDVLRGGDGKDLLAGGAGDDAVIGGSGADFADYSGAAGPVQVNLGTGTASGSAENDTLVAIGGVIGSPHGDTIVGNPNDNTLAGGTGNDTLTGGGGRDTADYSEAAAGVKVSLAIAGPQDTGGGGVDTLSGFADLIGSDHGDALTGDGGPNALSGGEGNDLLAGGEGDDALDGGAGDDALDGGAGEDSAVYSSAPGGISVGLGAAAPQVTGSAGTDAIAGVERLAGSPFADRLSGGAAAETLSGGGGDDVLDGAGANDVLSGGDGNDVADGGAGDDRALGEAGDDALSGGPGADALEGGPGNDRLTGGEDRDSLTGGEGSDALAGGPGRDAMAGDDGPDLLAGGPHADELRGGGSNDQLRGGRGADRLYGDDGRDTLDGGKGRDSLFGGSGGDRLLARDGVRDIANGGSGTDRARIDRRRDRTRSVESTRKPRKGRYRDRKRRVAPGVTLTRIVDRRGPRRSWVLAVDIRKGPTIDVALAQNQLPGFERTSAMARRYRALAAINGDFGLPSGRPVHDFAMDGDLKQSSLDFGYHFGISQDEQQVFMDEADASVSILEPDAGEAWQIDRLNDGRPALGQLAAFTPAGGTLETPPGSACSARLLPAGPPRWGDGQVGVRVDHAVSEVSCSEAPMPLGGGIVVSAHPASDAGHRIRSLSAGELLTLTWSFGWRGVLDAIGGYPLLMRDGKILARPCAESLCRRHPRTGIGSTPDGRLLLVVVDGRRARHSIGMTLVEFAREFERLGATWALNLDGGGSSTMVVKGKVVNRPSDRGGERSVSSAVLVLRGADLGEPVPASGARAARRAPPATAAPDLPDGRAAARDPGSSGGLRDPLDHTRTSRLR